MSRLYESWLDKPLLAQSGVAVEKGTKAVISVNFSAYGKRRFNNLQANFVREIPRFVKSREKSFSIPTGVITQSPVNE
jgi:hypothetical protein